MRRAIGESCARGDARRGVRRRGCSRRRLCTCAAENAACARSKGCGGEPSPKPPFPAEVTGLFGKPTVVAERRDACVIPVGRASRAADRHEASCVESGAVARPARRSPALGMTCGEILAARCRRRRRAARGAWRSSAARWDARAAGRSSTRRSHCQKRCPVHGPRRRRVVLDDTVSPRELAEHLFCVRARRVVNGIAVPRRHRSRCAGAATARPSNACSPRWKRGLCGFGSIGAQTAPRPAGRGEGGAAMITVDGSRSRSAAHAARSGTAAAPTCPRCADDRLSVGHRRSCMRSKWTARMVVCVLGRPRARRAPTCASTRRASPRTAATSASFHAVRRATCRGASATASPRTARATVFAPKTGCRDTSHPFIRFDADACILCRRCLRACEEPQASSCTRSKVAAPARTSRMAGRSPRAAASSCGACVTACSDRRAHEPRPSNAPRTSRARASRTSRARRAATAASAASSTRTSRARASPRASRTSKARPTRRSTTGTCA